QIQGPRNRCQPLSTTRFRATTEGRNGWDRAGRGAPRRARGRGAHLRHPDAHTPTLPQLRRRTTRGKPHEKVARRATPEARAPAPAALREKPGWWARCGGGCFWRASGAPGWRGGWGGGRFGRATPGDGERDHGGDWGGGRCPGGARCRQRVALQGEEEQVERSCRATTPPAPRRRPRGHHGGRAEHGGQVH
ncbi:hypothetical protein T484DRAFT_1878138, partial [Baffinella frigidus]